MPTRKPRDYRQRASPHVPAGQHRGQTLPGYAGGRWISKADADGRYAWRKLKQAKLPLRRVNQNRQRSPKRQPQGKRRSPAYYGKRPSPHVPAGPRRGQTLQGHKAGTTWKSQADQNGRYAWRQIQQLKPKRSPNYRQRKRLRETAGMKMGFV